MKVKKLNSSSDEINLSVKESDIGALYIIQHELLKNQDINFAGVMVKHPLTKECWMRVSTNESEPVKAVTDAADVATKNIEELESLFKSTIRES